MTATEAVEEILAAVARLDTLAELEAVNIEVKIRRRTTVDIVMRVDRKGGAREKED